MAFSTPAAAKVLLALLAVTTFHTAAAKRCGVDANNVPTCRPSVLTKTNRATIKIPKQTAARRQDYVNASMTSGFVGTRQITQLGGGATNVYNIYAKGIRFDNTVQYWTKAAGYMNGYSQTKTGVITNTFVSTSIECFRVYSGGPATGAVGSVQVIANNCTFTALSATGAGNSAFFPTCSWFFQNSAGDDGSPYTGRFDQIAPPQTRASINAFIGIAASCAAPFFIDDSAYTTFTTGDPFAKRIIVTPPNNP